MNPIKAYFCGPTNARRFENQMAFTDVMSILSVNRRMNTTETMDALLCVLGSLVQAMTDKTEWGDAGVLLADEIRRRLTVTGDTGDDHHVRRMV